MSETKKCFVRKQRLVYLNGEVPQNSKRPKFFLREYFIPTLYKEMYADDLSLLGMMQRRFGAIYTSTWRHMPLRPEPSSTPHILRSPFHVLSSYENESGDNSVSRPRYETVYRDTGSSIPRRKNRFFSTASKTDMKPN
jgi:hypothetical protein